MLRLSSVTLLKRMNKVPPHVKIELLLNGECLEALDRDQKGHFAPVRERCPFYGSPYKKEDTIVAIAGHTTTRYKNDLEC